MNPDTTITVTYRLRANPESSVDIAIDGSKFSPTKVLNAALGLMFPGVTPPERDLKWEAAMAAAKATAKARK